MGELRTHPIFAIGNKFNSGNNGRLGHNVIQYSDAVAAVIFHLILGNSGKNKRC